jgi:hypothetical protein
MSEDLLEATLVVVKALLRLVVYGSDVDDDVAGVEHGRIA